MADFAKNITDKCIIPKTCRERFLPLRPSSQPGNPLSHAGVFFSGISDLAGGYRISRKSTEFHLVIIGIGGRGVFETENLNGSIEPGDIFICPSGFPHRYSADGPWKILFFHIHAKDHAFEGSFQNVQLGISNSSAQLENSMIWLINENQRNGIHSKDLYHHHAKITFLCLDRELKNAASPELARTHNKLDGLWQEVSESLAVHWSLRSLAERMHISTAQLRRVVQAHHQMAPMEMVQALRIQKAQQLLKTTDDSLESIAERVGYLSPFSFSRAFKKSTGVSPRGYRTKTKENPYFI